jgi:two-component system chemotaxis sensor kinase CheA
MMDKQVKPIHFVGENPRVLAKTMQEFLFSLTHICRNIIDHGIETPVTRMARGKDPAGLVTISCHVLPEQDGETLRLVISDDGNGIDPARIRSKLAAKDPDGSWRFEDDQTVIQRIFSWGFTTREAVTSLSGRGVGAEAVELESGNLGERSMPPLSFTRELRLKSGFLIDLTSYLCRILAASIRNELVTC